MLSTWRSPQVATLNAQKTTMLTARAWFAAMAGSHIAVMTASPMSILAKEERGLLRCKCTRLTFSSVLGYAAAQVTCIAYATNF